MKDHHVPPLVMTAQSDPGECRLKCKYKKPSLFARQWDWALRTNVTVPNIEDTQSSEDMLPNTCFKVTFRLQECVELIEFKWISCMPLNETTVQLLSLLLFRHSTKSLNAQEERLVASP